MTYTTGTTSVDRSLVEFNKRRIRTYLAGLDGEGLPRKIEWAIALEEVGGEIRDFAKLPSTVQQEPPSE